MHKGREGQREKAKKAARLIRSAGQVVAFTGAGISTPSGIPDFRSANTGLWQKHNPMEVASLSAFRRDPTRFYGWFRPMADTITNAKPNPAHIALAELEQAEYLDTTITQNIDGLHQRAGAKNILEIHGTLAQLTCTHCFTPYPAKKFIAFYLEDGAIPHCANCNHVLKPDIILFEEQLPYNVWMKADAVSKSCHLMLVAGSSLTVTPAAGLPMQTLKNHASLVIINQEPTPLDRHADVVIHDDVAVVLPQIAQEVIYG